jgi:hypothetical protein
MREKEKERERGRERERENVRREREREREHLAVKLGDAVLEGCALIVQICFRAVQLSRQLHIMRKL